MVNSRAKGVRGELEARDAARRWWFARNCIRAGQACGKFSADLLAALPGAHLEVKLYAKVAALDFLRQAERDMRAGEFPVVLMRDNGRTSWTVCIRIEDTERFVQAYLKNKESNAGNDQPQDADEHRS